VKAEPLALSLGDPAGIGPEICVRALLAPDVRDATRSFVIGDARVLEKALSVCGLTASLHRIGGPEEIADRPGVIDVLHQDSADPAVLRMGEVQPLGGEAAFAAIKASIDLAMSHRVDGVVTAPINKESLKAAKIPFIGHTEMFAEYTGATEEMTMFTIVGLKIFFLTRHVSLAQACAQITVPRVSKGIDQCIRALHQLGLQYKRQRKHELAAETWLELTRRASPLALEAFEELEIHYEHHQRDPQGAIEFALAPSNACAIS